MPAMIPLHLRPPPGARPRAGLRPRVVGALLAALAIASCPARAGGWEVRVDDAWVRATVEGQSGSGAYLRITSAEDAQLVGAASAVAQKVEIHEMRTVNDRMSMRRIDRLALPAGVTVALEHDAHVMLIGLQHQLLPGQTVPLTLHVVDARGARHDVHVSAPVRPIDTIAGRPHADGH